MATISISTDLDVIAKHTELMQESLGADSVYIRLKETLADLLIQGDLTAAEQAKIISDTLVAATNSLTSSAMSTALSWSKAEKDYAYKELELQRELDILDSEVLLRAAQVHKMDADVIETESRSLRTYGQATIVSGHVAALNDTGKVYQDIQLIKEQVTKTIKEEAVLTSKLKESEASVHKLVADTYINFGSLTYTLSDAGLQNVTVNSSNTPLSHLQANIAEEQAKGYAYNAWSNALTGTSSTVGMMLSSELPIFSPGQIGAELITTMKNISDKLSSTIPKTLI